MTAARAVRLHAKATSAEAIAPGLEPVELSAAPGQVLVKVAAAGVNPSDVKAAMGLMPYAVFPRTPGRDFSGTVVGGTMDGQAVFGSSGDLGIRRDGTHASHLVVEEEALVPVPPGVSLVEAAGIGVPFVTAAEGFRRTGLPKAGETVLIMGVNGKVGQAAAQIAAWQGARVLGVLRNSDEYPGYISKPLWFVDAAKVDPVAKVLEHTEGRGADIVFNTVGDPYYEAGVRCLAKGGRMVLIASTGKKVEFDIFAFYRGRHTYVGIDTLALSSVETGAVLRGLMPGFAARALRPFPIDEQSRYSLADARQAYLAVLGSSRDRIVLEP